MNRFDQIKKKKILSGLTVCCYALIILLVSCRSHQQDEKGTLTKGINSDNTDRLEWFREAKFGMFIHWGPYSQLAGEWNGRKVPVGENAEWIMKNLSIPVSDYRELAHKMNPVRFDANEWVRLAKSAGMKYIVITAKHHDGFAMYYSDASTYNIYTGDWYEYHEFPVGYFELPDEGNYTLTIHPLEQGDKYLMYLRSIKLYPVNSSKESGWGTK